jgi:hypothetical protein
MTEISDLIRALASLMWPVIALVIVILLRKEFPLLVQRLRRASIGGQSIELDPQIRELEKRVEAAKEEQSTLPASSPIDAARSVNLARDQERLLELASRDRKLGIIAIAIEIERSLRELAAQLGLPDYQRTSLSALMTALVQRGAIGASTVSSLDVFWQVRNRLVHGQEREISEAEAATMIDIGLSLLGLINAVPHETYKVVDVVPVFGDNEARQQLTDVRGVILEVSSPGGTRTERRIYPTTKQYHAGKRVAWAWNMARAFPETWYREPRTGQVAQAWNSSAEFVGEELP